MSDLSRPGRRPGYVSTLRRFSEPTKTVRVPVSWDISALYASLQALDSVLTSWQQVVDSSVNLDQRQLVVRLLNDVRAVMPNVVPKLNE